MRSLRFLMAFVVVLLMAIISGCIPPFSLNPIYTDKGIIFDPDLLGSWVDDESNPWKFKKADDGSYDVIFGSEESESYYIAYLVKIQNTMYMDFYADVAAESQKHHPGNILVAPTHVFVKVIKTHNMVQLDAISYDWFEKYLKDNPDALPCVQILDEERASDQGTTRIITASTEELQKFIIEIQDNKEAYENIDFTLQKK